MDMSPDLPRIKRNIKRLMEQNAPVEDIDGYIASEGVTLDQLKAHKAAAPATGVAQSNGPLSWSDVPGQAWQNAPESAAHTAYAMLYPFLHPIDTATALGEIGKGAVSKVAGAVGVEQDPKQKAQTEAHINAVGNFFLQRYGSLEALKQTLARDPVGVMADASALFSGGGSLAGRAPGVIGQVGSKIAAAGSAVDPLANVGRVMNAAGKGTAAALGMTTGAGAASVETAFNAGRNGSTAFAENMRGQAPITDTLDMAQSAMRDIRKDRSDAYNAGMAGVKTNTGPISYQPVLDAVRKAESDIGYKGIPKSQDAMKTYHDIGQMVEWFHNTPGANTVEGLDALKQALGEIRQKTQHGTLERKVSDDVYNAVKGQIVAQAPGYAQAMRGYSQASDTIDDLTKTFSLGEKSSKDTAIRKLTSVMRNNVNTNYGRRAQLMDELAKKQPELPYAVAGQAMSSLTPRGISQIAASLGGVAGAVVNPATLGGLVVASPRVVGEAAYGAGRATGAIKQIADAFNVDLATAADLMRASYATKQASQPALVGEQDYGADTPEDIKRLRRGY